MMSYKPYIVKSHAELWKLPIGILFFIMLGLSPFIISFLGVHISEWITGIPCHEGNCFWATLPWISFISLPVSAVLLVVFLTIIIADLIKIYSNKN